MEYWLDGSMGRNRKIASLIILSCVISMPLLATAQNNSIIIGEGMRGAMYSPAYIAEEKGFFKRRELDTRIVTFSRSNDINALVAGDIQFDLTAPDKVIHSAPGGYPVKIVIGTASGLNLALVVHSK
jgi:ABC-type nitrate/sulfonate/bicarbonate transport system substrate-binding protein